MNPAEAGSATRAASTRRRRLPRSVVVLGVVSLLMAVSSFMILGLLPLYLVAVLGASALSVGVIEGVAEAANSLARVFSGPVSDWQGRRKPLVLAGYTLSALAKPLIPLAGDVGTVLAARFLDRTGKGIRDAPRDALLADELSPRVRGSGYGLRLALFTLGTTAGPLIASGVMLASGGDFRLAFWIAVLPGLASVAVLAFALHESPDTRWRGGRRYSLRLLGELPAAFWWVVAVAALLEVARFSQAFLLLKAKDAGLAIAYVPMLLALTGCAYAFSAYPFGRLADHERYRVPQFAGGIGVLVAAHIVLATAGTVWSSALGAALWGLQMGILQGLLAACIADTAPTGLRGTAFGVFYLVDGLVSLVGSSTAGALWAAGGPAWTFSAGAALATLALVLVMAKPLPRG
ncbi:MAG: MFS transporter [Burkholderiales bacterium]|nr:MFS transporter [Burkholderiales bacterium]